MNDTAIKNFAVWARRQLMDDVRLQMKRWVIDEAATVPADADVLNGAVMSTDERRQRGELLRACREEGSDALVERAAYTWFNRFIAIRFMELHDYLPCGLRFFSATDGSFDPQVLREALRADIEGIDRARVAEIVSAADDEALFRYLFIAQCNELAACMPAVFDRIGSAMELLLPAGLLREGSVIDRMVTDIPEDDWREGVEIVGWMYQYYVSERKDEVFEGFKKGKKAERGALAPATQLFTPRWIVQFLVENSLGRLWMLNHPESALTDLMPYYIKPDQDAEVEFKHVASPEEIALVDPACGSGHILVYAFDLLMAMYAEAGYVARDAARLILEKNLTGFEIDPRAAQMASFALSMKALEADSRFLRRAVEPRIVELARVEFTEDELELVPETAARVNLVDAAAHLDECGSLFQPGEGDLAAIAADLASLESTSSLFAESAKAKLDRISCGLEALAQRYDVVAANPPYMGSRRMNKWLCAWVKDRYPNSYRDLCACFVDRGFSLSGEDGYSSMVTMQSWMFLGSFEKLRETLLRDHSILCMAHLGTRAFGAIAGEVVSTTATVFGSRRIEQKGCYVRLVDGESEDEKRKALEEAAANPECGRVYQRYAADFKDIPGSPMAYWASDAMRRAFALRVPLGRFCEFKTGMVTGDNDRFLRLWWEVARSKRKMDSHNNSEALASGAKWFPYNKGGSFRKWDGNNDYLINYWNNGFDLFSTSKEEERNVTNLQEELRFMPMLTWSLVSSDAPSFRFKPFGFLYDKSGLSFSPKDRAFDFYLALCNSSVASTILQMIAPTIHYQIGDIQRIPVLLPSDGLIDQVRSISRRSREVSTVDWDSFETSWDFKRHPLV